MDQEHDFPPETSDHSGSECEEEESVIESEEENCSATDLIDALADIPKQSKFQDLTPNDKLPNDLEKKIVISIKKGIPIVTRKIVSSNSYALNFLILSTRFCQLKKKIFD